MEESQDLRDRASKTKATIPGPGGSADLLASALLCLVLVGCGHSPLRPDQTTEPALVPIRAAFERTIEQARQNPDVSWQSGWLGNASINLLGGPRRGLCYEWRNLVYAGVIDTVRAVGWDATGVVMSKYTYSEHSAVIVFDPARVPQTEILVADPGRPVYVLDAWRRGQADIYPLHVWLKLPLIVRSPAQIKPLPVKAKPETKPNPPTSVAPSLKPASDAHTLPPAGEDLMRHVGAQKGHQAPTEG